MVDLNGSKKTVLLVEDYAPNVLVAKSFVEQFGYECDVVHTGTDAVEAVKERDNYAAILMDVQMHGMNGLEATQNIRKLEQDESRTPIHIIGMTAHALAGDRQQCIDAGMNDYIAKPFDPDMLEQKLQAAHN